MRSNTMALKCQLIRRFPFDRDPIYSLSSRPNVERSIDRTRHRHRLGTRREYAHVSSTPEVRPKIRDATVT